MRCLLSSLVLLLAVVVGAISWFVLHIKHSPRRFLNGGVDPDHGCACTDTHHTPHTCLSLSNSLPYFFSLSVAERLARYRTLHANENPRTLHGFDYDAVEFAGEEGALRGWLVHGAPPPGGRNTTVIFSPGAGSTILVEPLRALPLFHAYANVLALDTASVGGSDGDNGVGFGTREYRDVLAAVEFVRARDPTSRIVLAGHSAGASASIHASTEIMVSGAAGGRIDGVIASSVFASFEEEAARVLVAGVFRSKIPASIRGLVDALVGERVARLLAAAVHLISWSHGEWLREPRDSLERAAAVANADPRKMQLLIIHGGDDALVHVDNVHRLARATASGSKVEVSSCIVDGGSHKFSQLWSKPTSCIPHSLQRFFAAVAQHE
jgi:alpha/beta superfamily hydrolase